MRWNVPGAVALLLCAVGLLSASPGYASSPCPWSTQSSPCPVKRSTSFSFWGKVSDVTAPASLTITTDAFAKVSKVNKLLVDEAGNDETVQVKSTTRFYLVNHSHQKSRIGPTAFWNEVDSYADATLYVTGRLAPGSYWDDDPTIVNAGVLVVDISELPADRPEPGRCVDAQRSGGDPDADRCHEHHIRRPVGRRDVHADGVRIDGLHHGVRLPAGSEQQHDVHLRVPLRRPEDGRAVGLDVPGLGIGPLDVHTLNPGRARSLGCGRAHGLSETNPTRLIRPQLRRPLRRASVTIDQTRTSERNWR